MLVVHLTVIVVLVIWWYVVVNIVGTRRFKDFVCVRILRKYLISPLSFECLIATLDSECLSTTRSCYLLAGFAASESSTSFVYVHLV